MAPKRRAKKKKKRDDSFCFLLFVFLFQRKVSFSLVLFRFHCNKEEEDDNCSSPSSMALPQNIADLRLFVGVGAKKGDSNSLVTFFYGGPNVKKAMVASNFLFFIFLGSLWFSLLELTNNNIMVIFLLRLKVIMVRRRRLRKTNGGDLEVHKQNVLSSDQVVAEEIIVSSNQLQIVVFSHQATAKGIPISSDQPIGEQNVAPLQLKHQKQNVASSDMKIRKLMYQTIYVD
jgi:hypothetical protein